MAIQGLAIAAAAAQKAITGVKLYNKSKKLRKLKKQQEERAAKIKKANAKAKPKQDYKKKPAKKEAEFDAGKYNRKVQKRNAARKRNKILKEELPAAAAKVGALGAAGYGAVQASKKGDAKKDAYMKRKIQRRKDKGLPPLKTIKEY
tara:strand:+ start:825 stop:1265 length:441 start_codon:yes stop_codon:yes gene_type:complete